MRIGSLADVTGREMDVLEHQVAAYSFLAVPPFQESVSLRSVTFRRCLIMSYFYLELNISADSNIYIMPEF